MKNLFNFSIIQQDSRHNLYFIEGILAYNLLKNKHKIKFAKKNQTAKIPAATQKAGIFVLVVVKAL